MKGRWSISKDKLVGVEEGDLPATSAPNLNPTPESRNSCKQLIQCLKLLLYLELLLFVGWASYSVWQTYNVESMETKDAESLRGFPPRNLNEETTTKPESLLNKVENLLQREDEIVKEQSAMENKMRDAFTDSGDRSLRSEGEGVKIGGERVGDGTRILEEKIDESENLGGVGKLGSREVETLERKGVDGVGNSGVKMTNFEELDDVTRDPETKAKDLESENLDSGEVKALNEGLYGFRNSKPQIWSFEGPNEETRNPETKAKDVESENLDSGEVKALNEGLYGFRNSKPQIWSFEGPNEETRNPETKAKDVESENLDSGEVKALNEGLYGFRNSKPQIWSFEGPNEETRNPETKAKDVESENLDSGEVKALNEGLYGFRNSEPQIWSFEGPNEETRNLGTKAKDVESGNSDSKEFKVLYDSYGIPISNPRIWGFEGSNDETRNLETKAKNLESEKLDSEEVKLLNEGLYGLHNSNPHIWGFEGSNDETRNLETKAKNLESGEYRVLDDPYGALNSDPQIWIKFENRELPNSKEIHLEPQIQEIEPLILPELDYPQTKGWQLKSEFDEDPKEIGKSSNEREWNEFDPSNPKQDEFDQEQERLRLWLPEFEMSDEELERLIKLESLRNKGIDEEILLEPQWRDLNFEKQDQFDQSRPFQSEKQRISMPEFESDEELERLIKLETTLDPTTLELLNESELLDKQLEPEKIITFLVIPETTQDQWNDSINRSNDSENSFESRQNEEGASISYSLLGLIFQSALSDVVSEEEMKDESFDSIGSDESKKEMDYVRDLFSAYDPFDSKAIEEYQESNARLISDVLPSWMNQHRKQEWPYSSEEYGESV